ncbi:hypothetical protein LA374_09620 [Aeromonas schubertii]|uniref:Uncharacterized protein n=1 Tax=Aeromonas schubertii TaxID=652 RepID=A0ABS7VAP5_9GAMM|nr:hypothetical protein [Aeromonas schubertii]MBZ6066461.1 hypothetical protein [Aeromonas schubertii]
MMTFLTSLFSAIPLFTAALYLSGMAYYYGKCLAHGLDIAEFPQPTDVTLATGYLLWLYAGKVWATTVLLIFLAIFFVIIVLLCSANLRLSWSWRWHQIISSIHSPRVRRFIRKQARIPAPKLGLVFAWLHILYDRMAILALPALLIMLPAASFFLKGMNESQEQIKQFESGHLSPQSAQATSPTLGDTPHLRLMCNTMHCAYRFKDGTIKLVRHDQIVQVTWQSKN